MPDYLKREQVAEMLGITTQV